ncbi:MAG TPA: hypothetical protein VFJ93_06035 [Gaiellaceae bacterium]|nr:hypothetical protein [Gaiellaceae bacterium]
MRKAVAGEREPTETMMQAVARVLKRPPDYFVEYRLLRARNQLDPRVVGFETAQANLGRWAENA